MIGHLHCALRRAGEVFLVFAVLSEQLAGDVGLELRSAAEVLISPVDFVRLWQAAGVRHGQFITRWRSSCQPMSEGALSTIGHLRQGLAMSPSTGSAVAQLNTTGSTSNGEEEHWPKRAKDLLSGGWLPLRVGRFLLRFFLRR